MTKDPSSQGAFTANKVAPASASTADYTTIDTPYGSYAVPEIFVDRAGRMVTHGGNHDSDGAETAEKKAKQLEEKKKNGPQNHEYLVRGAVLRCQFGSHTRYLNLPRCHGVYVKGKPLIHERDCLVGDAHNIPTFGVCSSPDNPCHGEITVNEWDAKHENKKTTKGIPCKPMIIKYWRVPCEETRIGNNPGDSMDGKPPGDADYPAVTMNSFLICRYLGIIKPDKSGQLVEDEHRVKPREKATIVEK